MTPPRDILVIKLSALGDMVQAFPAFARVRAAHPEAHITLLTTPPYAALATVSPFFDAVEDDGRPKSLPGALALIRRLRRRRPDLVYDLQGNDRTNALFQSLRPFPPRWSGVALGCALPHANPDRRLMHTLERQAEQLMMAGAWPDAPTAPGASPPPDGDWLLRQAAIAPPEALVEPRPVIVLVPGAAPSRPAKRWPSAAYAALAGRLGESGFAVQLVGGPAEMAISEAIQKQCPGVTNLVGRTDLFGLAQVGARAVFAVGNDTGPLHLIASVGTPSLALFSAESDPALCAPRGRGTVRLLRVPDLSDLTVETVYATTMAEIDCNPR